MQIISLAGTPLVGALFISLTEQKKHEIFSNYNQRVQYLNVYVSLIWREKIFQLWDDQK